VKPVGGLIGRDEERERLRGVLDRARRGLSDVIVVRGAPGVGKTALLQDVQEAADEDFETIRFDAVESEAELGFAALHQLLVPYLGNLPKLPEPQSAALNQVFGFATQTAPPDRFLIGLASVGLLAARPEGRPLLCVVDDAHWLDQESAQVLAFVARRLYAESVAMIFAARELGDGVDQLAGLPKLDVAGLDEKAAITLLGSIAAGKLDPELRTRILAFGGGNPLALIEAARELSSGQLDGQTPLPEPIPLGASLERIYFREVQALPSRTRTLVLTAAADPTSDPLMLWRAGATSGFDVSDAAAAEERNLLTIRDRVRFRHPLIRSAIYYSSPISQRARAHAALAAAAGDLGAQELRTWQLAAAATGPDKAIAAELERAADGSRQRGGWAESSALLARSASLTADRSTRAGRLLRAAQDSTVAGSPRRAQALLDQAAVLRDDHRYHGLVQRVQARIHRLAGDPAAATAALLAGARSVGSADIRLARDILVEALVQAQISDSLAPPDAVRQSVAETVRSLPLSPDVLATTGDLILEADTALHLEGLSAAIPRLKEAAAAACQEEPGAPELLQWLAAACSHATILGDDITLHALAGRLEGESRRQGAVIPMALALSHTALSELTAGHLDEAERLFDRRAVLEEAHGREFPLGALLVAAWRGHVGKARQLTEAVRGNAHKTGQGYQLVFCDYASSVIELSQGNYFEAYRSLNDRLGDTSQLSFALADMVEAATRCGRNEETAQVIQRLADLTGRTPVPALLGDLARARALVTGDPDEASRLYRDAISHHENSRGPSRRARSHQLYGEWLRRNHRPKEAAEHLRIAFATFDAMGSAGYATRTAHELYAAGEPIPLRDGQDATDALTVQEARIARLAAGGATNGEIAAQLYLSVHTVDYHLRKVFKKLGINARRELAGRRDLRS
jgi:DNA-binding CsgD family transcriptional regulator